MIRHLIAAAMMVSALALPARAAELVMFERDGCWWCKRWHQDIGPIYPKTRESCIAPLRRVDITQPMPGDLSGIAHGGLTPTFVLVDEGREVGRIRGYPGDEFFWFLLGELLEKLDPATLAKKAC
ncbi:MAG: hypothetical protein C0606_03005 [Hyphomicrobiales bacterium]|nr:MAG: hypothetical protein C0606_03005 [Hyphomicrobiales bacterium]